MTTILEAIHIESGKAVGARAQSAEEVLIALDESMARADLTAKQIDELYQAADLCARLSAITGSSEGRDRGWIVRCRHIE